MIGSRTPLPADRHVAQPADCGEGPVDSAGGGGLRAGRVGRAVRLGRYSRVDQGVLHQTPGDRGSTVVEAVLVVPVLMVLLLLVVQFVLWSHAAQSVQAAAAEGDRVARSYGGEQSSGVQQAEAMLQDSGSSVTDAHVTLTVLAGDLVEVQVTGDAVTVLPGLTLAVSAVQVGPIQEFRAAE
jgi:hypothetical protein